MKVICVSSRGYYNLTEGKHYQLLRVLPPVQADNGFVYPKYVVVNGDYGKETTCHAYRFTTLDGTSCEDDSII